PAVPAAKIGAAATTAALVSPPAPAVSGNPAKPATLTTPPAPAAPGSAAKTAALVTPPAPAAPGSPPQTGAFVAPRAPAAPAKPGPETTGSGKLSLSAVVVNGAKPVKESVSWTISRPAKTSGGADEIVTIKQAAAPKLALPPGHYRVMAQYGLAAAV